jgi:hypothetical protein
VVKNPFHREAEGQPGAAAIKIRLFFSVLGAGQARPAQDDAILKLR